MAKLRPATNEQRIRAKAAEFRLRAALEDAEAADCPKLAHSIRSALKSADGARRHMERRRAAISQRSDQP
ncbi:MAG: hypothetical protein K0S00_4445 [Xanthobacteraceae bacterium]|jgi:hypothetical protein|nr:hypothetical protein [Xanthobacteraceae bacterium]